MTLSEVLKKAEDNGVSLNEAGSERELHANDSYFAIVQWLAERGWSVHKHDSGEWHRTYHGLLRQWLTGCDSFESAILLAFSRELDNSRDARGGGGE